LFGVGPLGGSWIWRGAFFGVGLLGLRQIWRSDLFSVGQKVQLCGENSGRRLRRDKLGLGFERRRRGLIDVSGSEGRVDLRRGEARRRVGIEKRFIVDRGKGGSRFRMATRGKVANGFRSCHPPHRIARPLLVPEFSLGLTVARLDELDEFWATCGPGACHGVTQLRVMRRENLSHHEFLDLARKPLVDLIRLTEPNKREYIINRREIGVSCVNELEKPLDLIGTACMTVNENA
jgi:hypothetical protein